MINDQLNALYDDRYGADFKKCIIPCGIVSEEDYLRSKPRIVFVLKEAHTSRSGFTIPDNLIKHVRKGTAEFEKGYGHTWNQVGVWAYAIHNEFKTYRELCNPKNIAEGIRTIGMTNLKKTGGGATAVPKLIKSSARNDVSLWRRELEIMDPDLVICGGTFRNTVTNLKVKASTVMLIAEKGKNYYYHQTEFNGHKVLILQFWHPACRKKREDILVLLGKMIQQIKAQRLIELS